MRSVSLAIPLLLTVLCAQQTSSQRDFWEHTVREPLTGPNAERLYRENYKDAIFPPRGMKPYLEGAVASVVSNGKAGSESCL